MASVATRPLRIEHVTISCGRNFDTVASTLESLLPELDANLLHLLKSGREEDVALAREDGPPLYLFLKRQHGALLAVDGMVAKANQYEIGNPITAASMTRRNLGAGLYAPLRVVLYEDAQGQARFEYDLPSSLFSQFGETKVSEVGRALDADLQAVLLEAAG